MWKWAFFEVFNREFLVNLFKNALFSEKRPFLKFMRVFQKHCVFCSQMSFSRSYENELLFLKIKSELRWLSSKYNQMAELKTNYHENIFSSWVAEEINLKSLYIKSITILLDQKLYGHQNILVLELYSSQIWYSLRKCKWLIFPKWHGT